MGDPTFPTATLPAVAMSLTPSELSTSPRGRLRPSPRLRLMLTIAATDTPTLDTPATPLPLPTPPTPPSPVPPSPTPPGPSSPPDTESTDTPPSPAPPSTPEATTARGRPRLSPRLRLMLCTPPTETTDAPTSATPPSPGPWSLAMSPGPLCPEAMSPGPSSPPDTESTDTPPVTDTTDTASTRQLNASCYQQ